MEKDNEVKGIGNSLDFGARIYDSRLGKWLSTDPMMKHNMSSYQFGGDNPICFIDPDGNTRYYFNGKFVHDDGAENNLIAIIHNHKGVKRCIKKGRFKYPEPDQIENGTSNADLFVIDGTVLNTANNVLKEAAAGRNAKREIGARLNKTEDGYVLDEAGYQRGEEVREVGQKAHVTIPGKGGVMIHSHLYAKRWTKINGEWGFKNYDAKDPSSDDVDIMKNHNLDMFIIVGESGTVMYDGGTGIQDGGANERGGVQTEPIPNKRNESINIFNQETQEVENSISSGQAQKILDNYNSTKR